MFERKGNTGHSFKHHFNDLGPFGIFNAFEKWGPLTSLSYVIDGANIRLNNDDPYFFLPVASFFFCFEVNCKVDFPDKIAFFFNTMAKSYSEYSICNNSRGTLAKI